MENLLRLETIGLKSEEKYDERNLKQVLLCVLPSSSGSVL